MLPASCWSGRRACGETGGCTDTVSSGVASVGGDATPNGMLGRWLEISSMVKLRARQNSLPLTQWGVGYTCAKVNFEHRYCMATAL